MPYLYEFMDRGEYLYVVAKGEVKTFDELAGYAQAMKAEVDSLGLKRLLVNELEGKVSLSAYDAVMLAESIVNDPEFSNGYRIAVVYAPENEAITRAFETVFRNRSLNHRMFLDERSALDWLLE